MNGSGGYYRKMRAWFIGVRSSSLCLVDEAEHRLFARFGLSS